MIFPPLCFLLMPLVAHEHPHRAVAVVDSAKIAFYENRVHKNPEDIYALAKLGQLTLRRARRSGQHHLFLAAESLFRQLLALDETHAQGLPGLAYALIGRHGFREALELARMNCEIRPDAPESWALLGDVHFALGAYAEAEMCYTRLMQQPNLNGLVRMAQVEEIRGRHERALHLLNTALDQPNEQPGTRAWCFTMIGDLYLNMGDELAAERAFKQADASVSDYADWRLAQISWRRGLHHDADHRMHDLVARKPDALAYAFSRARMLRRRDHVTQADALFEKTQAVILAAVEKDDLGHVRPLLQAWLERGIHLEMALALALRERNEVRADLEAHELVGWAQFRLGRLEEAEKSFNKALRPGLGTTRTLLRAGIVFYHTGARVKAAQVLRLALERGYPADRFLQQEARELLCDLQTNPRSFIPSWPAL